MAFFVNYSVMRKLIEMGLQSVLEDGDTSVDVCEAVWEKLFSTIELTNGEDREAVRVFDTIYAECTKKMIKTLEKGETEMDEEKRSDAEICTCGSNDLPEGVHVIGCPARKLSVRQPTIGSDDFKEDCLALGAQIEETKQQTRLVIREHPVFDDDPMKVGYTHPAAGALSIEQFGEMQANLKLAFRHLEDARMRLGKAIQAFDGGESCYPR